jgi:hypothetical protein
VLDEPGELARTTLRAGDLLRRTLDSLDAAPSQLSLSQGEEEILWGLRQIVIERT